MFKIAGMVLALASLAGCIVAGKQESPVVVVNDGTKSSEVGEAASYTPIRFNLSNRNDIPSDADITRCDEAGGKVQRAGLLGAYHCVQKYPDAGKTCRDSDECIGQCRAVSHEDVGKQNVTGTCQELDIPFGCYGIVESGAVGPMLCVD